MKKIIVLIACFLIVASVLVSCGKTNDKPDEIIPTRTYSNEFFSIDYPEGYTPMKIGNTNPGVIISAKDTNIRFEAYANWNDSCRDGDTSRLWQYQEEYWDDLTEVKLGNENALFAYTEDNFEWPFMSVTIPKNGWEMIATATEFTSEEYDFAKEILLSLVLTDPNFKISFEGVMYEEFDTSQVEDKSDTIHDLGAISIRSDCKLISKNNNNMKLKCSDYQIDILYVVDWKSKMSSLKYIKRFQDWEGVELGSQVVKEILIDGLDAYWSESLREKSKTISLTIPFDEGYVLVAASNLRNIDSIKDAASSLFSIEILDKLYFGTK